MDMTRNIWDKEHKGRNGKKEHTDINRTKNAWAGMGQGTQGQERDKGHMDRNGEWDKEHMNRNGKKEHTDINGTENTG